jgi:curved DNA-binding protein CbpA
MEDYYQILRVHPNASETTIRKAYRKLALQYHPDKTGNSEELNSYFKKINEAYKVLSNAEQRKQFHLQYYALHHYEPVMNSSNEILVACKKLLKQIIQQGDHINEEAIVLNIQENILNENNLFILKTEENKFIQQQLHEELLQIINKLNFVNGTVLSNILMQKFSFTNESEKVLLIEILKKKKQEYYWDKYKFFLALLIAILICLGIYSIT